MSLVTVPQVNPNDEVTALSVNQGPNAIAAVLNGNIDDANVSTISGTKISTGTLPGSSLDTAANPETRENETLGNIIASGLVWSTTTGLSGTMTAGIAYVNGKRLSVTTVASYAFTASRDTYIYVDSSGVIQYSPQTNGAAQPATPANNQLIAKVVTNGSTITSINDLRVLSIQSPWQNWLPNLQGVTVGNGTVVAVYKQVGKTVNGYLSFVLGSTSAVSGLVSFTLPVVANSRYTTIADLGLAHVTAGAADIIGSVESTSVTTARVIGWTANGTYVNVTGFTATVPGTWATGSQIVAQFMYEAA